MITPSIVVFILLVKITSLQDLRPIVFTIDGIYSKENCESMSKIVKAHYESKYYEVQTKCVMVRKVDSHQ